MSTVDGDRSVADAAHPGNGSSEQFLERRRDHRYAQLREHWTACPECGGPTLRGPGPELHRRVPEAAGVCASCGGAFASGPDGRLRLLVPRSTREVVHR
jgi:hypothetical protein